MRSFKEVIGPQIKKLRGLRRMTQQQLADAAHVHRITITKIENGTWDSSTSTLEKIAVALGAEWEFKLKLIPAEKRWPYPRLLNYEDKR